MAVRLYGRMCVFSCKLIRVVWLAYLVCVFVGIAFCLSNKAEQTRRNWNSVMHTVEHEQKRIRRHDTPTRKRCDVFPSQDPSGSKGSADPAPGADESVLERFQKRLAEINASKKAQGASV